MSVLIRGCNEAKGQVSSPTRSFHSLAESPHSSGVELFSEHTTRHLGHPFETSHVEQAIRPPTSIDSSCPYTAGKCDSPIHTHICPNATHSTPDIC